MDTKEYLKKLAKCIKVTSARKAIIREYEEHIEDHKAALIESGGCARSFKATRRSNQCW